MAHSFFAFLSRMRYISRWGLMRNTQQENIQEHSHMVAVLAHALAIIRRDVFHGEANPEFAATAALYHDAPEIFTGDLPTPVKYYNPEIRAAYKEVETVSAGKLLAMLPQELRGAYDHLLREDYDKGTRQLVKAADKLSAHIKCLEELKAGNREFQQAAEQTLAAVKAMGLPEADYFIEHFLPAFGLTLDELQECRGRPRGRP